MEIELNELEITNNPAENRFEVWIDGQLSKLDYIEDGDTIVMTHVGVHPEHRGGGVAGRITQVALEYAKQRNLRVIPMCSYVASYIRRNPQYIELTKNQGN
ncbi:MAG: GNAT family N-acetyltransferase [Anaerolineales bacterium]|nr:GNAT family N-acetyltransferase [Anaerolineales bacterium]WKZ41276.1 MAG: GNAT family N-acetyltransferase [Anaerolineales bacterium]